MGYLTRQNSIVGDCLKEARRIAKSYAKERDAALNAIKLIGKRKTLRNPIPPFRQPDAVLKYEIYKLALEIHVGDATGRIEKLVRERDEPFRHKPRNATAIDWAIRLVDRAPRVKQPLHGFKIVDPLFDPTFASHLATELNFAFQHEVAPQCASMFIDHVGGHEIISAMKAAGGYDLSHEIWVAKLRDHGLQHYNRRNAKRIERDAERNKGDGDSGNETTSEQSLEQFDKVDDDGW